MWAKTTCCCHLYLLLIIRKSIYNLVLVQTHTSMEAPTYRGLQLSLVFQLLLEGSCNTLALVLANVINITLVPAYKRLRPSLFLQGPCVINFLTGCSWYTPIHMKALFHQIFILDPLETLKLKLHQPTFS